MTVGNINAQDVFTSKNGIPILPKAGDFAIGINALPVLEFVGNSFNGNMFNTTSFDFLDGRNYIFGKYFAEDLLAYRFMLRVGLNQHSLSKYVTDDLDTEMLDLVLDKHTMNKTNLVLGVGLEKRRGTYRIQGFAGADLMFGYMSGSDKYAYGNEITETNPLPTTYNFGTNLHPGGARTLSESTGMSLNFGARAFVGVEYFVFPKLSLGGEFGWGLNVGFRGDSKINLEVWNPVELEVEEREWTIDKASHFVLDTDNLGGLIKLMFHF